MNATNNHLSNHGAVLPIPLFTTYYDVNSFLQRHIPHLLPHLHTIKIGQYQDHETVMDPALILLSEDNHAIDNIIHTIGNISPRIFFKTPFHIRRTNNHTCNYSYYKIDEHAETLATASIVQQAKLNCDPSPSKIMDLNDLISRCPNEQEFFQKYISYVQTNTLPDCTPHTPRVWHALQNRLSHPIN
eukprot:scaffold13395_cov71-Cyclotella_meneghiniana.AAC.5